MLTLNAFTRNCRRAAAFGALAIGAIAFSGSASAAPQAPLFPFFLVPPAQQYAPPPAVEAAPAPPGFAPVLRWHAEGFSAALFQAVER